MKIIGLLFCAYVLLGASACGDIAYKTVSTGGGTANINDQDGSIIVDAQDDARVIAGNAAEGNDQREEIGGIPLDSVDNIETVGVQTDVCAGPPVLSAETCAARTANLSDK